MISNSQDLFKRVIAINVYVAFHVVVRVLDRLVAAELSISISLCKSTMACYQGLESILLKQLEQHVVKLLQQFEMFPRLAKACCYLLAVWSSTTLYGSFYLTSRFIIKVIFNCSIFVRSTITGNSCVFNRKSVHES